MLACHISTCIALGIPLSNSARIFAGPRNSSRRPLPAPNLPLVNILVNIEFRRGFYRRYQ